ncbi:MAG: hypothetical protein A2504_10675 [Bdellovibrionales bacterium RIFOXYD12_FULL_39_22]|nr:MAG: hypothetical protein A2385_14310 [Bdellovibrionales bacterium RIFOXYB1_FULL_39_21]OFZ40407.1 MAG: hypothetical protein A2485_03000 [Bdellovibrionales bacterium RIFOXYC12_FULL_39_17]OFZ49656.1 MAG: hypothetical protein A2404_09460 [Bdellovibrionales bacterium RIFOXYC1_FULL_39_130]OFZ77326.1 MAG: hypothetical protein A2560_06125 [Bdellovibrionales bacterium RIFOXYD1_FULL_39_84]OFZ95981.1 MAG: hypothetical protein A2504_10675 [Bdellovibrionales bacterium RIFOXYD12_FULL_39_22]HLE11242.1 hy
MKKLTLTALSLLLLVTSTSIAAEKKERKAGEQLGSTVACIAKDGETREKELPAELKESEGGANKK